MFNFLEIMYTEIYYNRFIFRQVIQNTKEEGAFLRQCICTLWKIKMRVKFPIQRRAEYKTYFQWGVG